MDKRWAARGLRTVVAVVIGVGAACSLAGTAPSAAAPPPRPSLSSTTFETPVVTWAAAPTPAVAPASAGSTSTTGRSEERRVGKEGGTRGVGGALQGRV